MRCKLGLSTRENVKATTRPLRRLKDVCGVGRRRLDVIDVTGFVAVIGATVVVAAVVAVDWWASRCPAVAAGYSSATEYRFER